MSRCQTFTTFLGRLRGLYPVQPFFIFTPVRSNQYTTYVWGSLIHPADAPTVRIVGLAERGWFNQLLL